MSHIPLNVELADRNISISLAEGEAARDHSLEQALERAQTALQQRRLPEAEFISLQIVEKFPAVCQAYEPLFQLYFYTARYAELEAICQRCIRHCADYVEAYLKLSAAFRYQRQHSAAKETLQAGLSIAPENADIHYQLGVIQKEAGEFASALASFNRSIDLAPQSSGAYWSRADLHTSVSDQDIEAMTTLAQGSSMSDADRANIRYALAVAYEHRADYQRSFQQLQQGAQHKRKTLDYNHAREMHEFDQITQVFTGELLASRGSQITDDAPVFICGMPRSGTTLLEQILSSHPKVVAGDELFELAAATGDLFQKKPPGKPYPRWAPDLTAEDWQFIGESYLARTKPFQTARHFTDKMPLNLKAIGVIHLALPQARIIHCLRHPLDTIIGCYKQLFEGMPFSYDLDELTDTYLAYSKVMDHWHKVLPGKILDVRYEDIVNDNRAETQKILQFLGLEWSESCVNFHENKRVVHTASNSQVRQPLFNSSIGRWRKYEKHLSAIQDRLSRHMLVSNPAP